MVERDKKLDFNSPVDSLGAAEPVQGSKLAQKFPSLFRDNKRPLESFFSSNDMAHVPIEIPPEQGNHRVPISIPGSVIKHRSSVDDVLRSLERMGNHKHQMKIDAVPFGCVHLSTAQLGQTTCQSLEPLACVLGFPQRRMRSSSLFGRLIQWKLREQSLEIDPRIKNVVKERDGENRVRFPSEEESPLNGRSKYCSEDSCNCPDGSPSIPVNNTRSAEPPTLGHAVKNAHSLIPPCTGRHSATQMPPAEKAHG